MRMERPEPVRCGARSASSSLRVAVARAGDLTSAQRLRQKVIGACPRPARPALRPSPRTRRSPRLRAEPRRPAHRPRRSSMPPLGVVGHVHGERAAGRAQRRDAQEQRGRPPPVRHGGAIVRMHRGAQQQRARSERRSVRRDRLPEVTRPPLGGPKRAKLVIPSLQDPPLHSLIAHRSARLSTRSTWLEALRRTASTPACDAPTTKRSAPSAARWPTAWPALADGPRPPAAGQMSTGRMGPRYDDFVAARRRSRTAASEC
jgi:hypothetical protein